MWAQLILDGNPGVPSPTHPRVSPALALSSQPPLPTSPQARWCWREALLKPTGLLARFTSGETEAQRGQASPQHSWAGPLLC